MISLHAATFANTDAVVVLHSLGEDQSSPVMSGKRIPLTFQIVETGASFSTVNFKYFNLLPGDRSSSAILTVFRQSSSPRQTPAYNLGSIRNVNKENTVDAIDEAREAVCFRKTNPMMYAKARAVARLMIRKKQDQVLNSSDQITNLGVLHALARRRR
ncbi:hypothetical protein PsorP6_000914 [Peronosclerospora sorghi]|uniref:Uncharacterized protein n=1 Tax=Peronosclerospora sorghi TaxID=230839 RepID=A0ACC0WVK6_9STRA|nr:hypothetical protein PsorP6_000914 [Peronosclerospora sorghi]